MYSPCKQAQRSASYANPSHAPSTTTTDPTSRKSSLFSSSTLPSRPVSSHSPLPPVVGSSESIANGDQPRVLSPTGGVPLSDDEEGPAQDKKKRKRFSAAISRIAHGRSGSRPASMLADGPTIDKGKRVASPLPPVEHAQIRPFSVALDGLTQGPLTNGTAEDLQHDVKKDDGVDKSKGKRPIAEPENGLDSVLNGDPKPPAASPSPPEADRARSLSSMDSEEDPFARMPSRPISVRDKSRSRGASAYTSPAASRPVSGGAFVPPEEWDTLPTLSGGRGTPNERTPQTDRHMLPSQRSLERLRRNSSPQVLQNLRSSSLLSSKRSLAELPETPEREPSDQLIERLGVLPSPSIEPMNWPEEKQRRKTVGADQRLERVVESVVRHSASLSSRELKGKPVSRKPSKVQDDAKDEATGTPTLQPGFQEEKPAGTRSGALSSRPSFVRDRRSTPSLRAAPSRGSIRTRGSKASISSLLPIPLDEVARRSMAREEGEGAGDAAEVATSGKVAEESVNEIAEAREPSAKIVEEKTVSPVRSLNSSAPDASAGAPLSPGLSFHTAASEREDEPFELPLEKDPVGQEVGDKERAASPVKKVALAMDKQVPEAPTSGPRPQPGQGEWLVPRTRKQRKDPRQGPHGFTSSVPGLVDASSHARFQKSAPGVVEYRASQGEPPMPQRFMSPPPGLVEYGTQQGRRGAPQAFQPFVEERSSTSQEIAKEFDPRAYTPEFTLPGVGPPDLSRSDTKRKSFLGVGIPGSKHSTPPSGSSVERINERINPRDLDLAQRKFSYQSSNDERQETDVPPAEPPVRRGSRGFLPFRRTSVANESTESQNTSRSGSGFGAAVASLAPPPAAIATPTPMSGPSVGPSPNKKGRNVLQRNHSVAVTSSPEPKEKAKRRGSIFGSLFGRSASTSQAKEKGEKKTRRAEGKRLSKMPAVTETRTVNEALSDGLRPSQGQPYEAIPEIPLHLQPSGESQSRIYHKEPSLPNVNPTDLHRPRGLKTPPPPRNYYIPSGPENQPPMDAGQQIPQPSRSRYYQPQGPLNSTTPPRPQPSRYPSQPGSVNGPPSAPTQPYIVRQSTMPEFSNFPGMHASPPDSRIASPPTREWSRSRGPDPAPPMISYMPSRPNSAVGQGFSRPQSKTPPIPRPDPFTAQRIFYEQQRKQQHSDQDDASRNGSINEATHYVPGPPTFDDSNSRMLHYAPTPPPPEVPPQQQQQQPRPYQLSLPPNPTPEARPRSNPRFESPESFRPSPRPEPRWREASPQEIQQFQQKQMQSRLSSERQYETPFYAPVRPSSRGGPMSWAADPYHRRGSAPPIAYAPPPPHNGPPPPQMHLPPPARSYTDQVIYQTYSNGMAPQDRRRSSSGHRPGPEAYVPYRGSAVYDFPDDDDATYNDGNFENKRDSRGRWPGFANAEAQAQAEAYADARMSAVRAQSRSRSRSASQSRGSRSRSRGRPVGAGSGARPRGLSQGSVPAAAPNGTFERSAGPEGRKSLGQGEEPVRMLGSSYPGMEWHPGVGLDGQ
ncbi:hypothetical protein JOL62DRAFT_273326 [Phyllosticta paracitricarpa]|uniref:Proteophosphoglycan ppg4 n=2 Tax=Phyllosticta TaxID=121621 RepID=A0ABR1L2F2_9PEZI